MTVPPHRNSSSLRIGYVTPSIPVTPDRLIITAGLQHAMTICIAALCEPGDIVLAESLTYPGIRALGMMHHLRRARRLHG